MKTIQLTDEEYRALLPALQYASDVFNLVMDRKQEKVDVLIKTIKMQASEDLGNKSTQ